MADCWTSACRPAGGDGADLVAGDGFLFEQGGGELVEGLAVAGEQVAGAGFGLGQQGGDFLVDQPLGVLGVAACGGERGIAGGRAAVADRADRLAEAELADHLGGQGGGGGQVVGGAGGCLAADQAFGGPAAEADGEGVGQVAFAVEPAVVGGEHLGQPEGLPGAQHGDPADRVGVRGQGGDQGVAGLVDGDGGEFGGGQRAGVPGAEQHAVAGAVEVGGGEGGAAGPDRGDGGLVDQVGQVRAGESGGGGGDLVQVGVRAEVLAAGVGGQDGARSARSGSGTTTSRSNRPGRRSAGSRASGRLVAASTTTPPESSNPSISASSWFRVCSRSSLPARPPWSRRAPRASISSMNTMAGPRVRACSNRSRTRAAPTPTNISTKPEPDTEKNGTWASPATARASRVLPVPGGPAISTPRGPRAPARW
jgi:hypothetical protein